jgi:D-lactate dehydrogenase (cytochrome)
MEPMQQSVVDAQIIDTAFGQLSTLLKGRATRGESQREHHSRGESYLAAAMPDIVCFPQSTQEVSEILKIAARHDLPIVPFGAGTSIEGQVSALRGGISIDMLEMKKVLRLSVPDSDVTVEAGITRKHLVEKLANTGLTFFIDPGADATIGGMASTRASGTTAVKYGTMRDNVLGLTVVLADGRIIKTGSRARKSSAGYDLTALFVGAEGTLGVITEVTLRLHPLPESVSVAVCSFDTIKGAIETVIEAVQFGLGVARVEFLDEQQIIAINRYSKTNLSALPTLFFEFHGISSRMTSDQAEMLQTIAAEHGGQEFQWKHSLEAQDELWSARHAAYYAAHALLPNSKVFVTDVCVPISRLADCISETKNDLSQVSFPATVVGHVGDGNFHVLCVFREGDEDQLAEVHRFADGVVRRALRMGGTCTGEHGIGFGKLKYLREEHGDSLETMRDLKLALDPTNRMNPGKIISGDFVEVGLKSTSKI